MNELLKGYTSEELNEIKDAIYMIADAQQKLKDVSEGMAREKRWYGQGDIAGIVGTIEDHITGDEGCLHSFLKVL